MIADARRRRLAERLVERGSITVRDCAVEFGVTTETIRKDILHLETIGLAHKRFGGAVVSQNLSEGRPAVKGTAFNDAKSLIAARALELVPDGGNILIDGGTTTKALGERLALRSGYTIFTNSIPLFSTLGVSDNDVFIIGGRLHTPTMSNVGRWAVQAMRSTKVDIAFLGTDGHRGADGPMSSSYDESEFKASVIASSRTSVVLGDSSKFARTGLFQFSTWIGVDTLITDDGVSPDDLARVAADTDVLVV